MGARRTRSTAVTLFAVAIMVGSVGAGTVLLTGAPGARAASPADPVPAPSGHAALPSPPPAPEEKSVPSAAASNVGSAMAARALAASRAAGIKPGDVFVPRASASAAQEAESRAQGHIVPLYSGSPAPLGLSDLGLSAGARGQVIPSILNTTSVEGAIAFNGTGVVPDTLVDTSPDAFTVQLNAVVTNVTLFGHDNYSFWTQNVLEYLPSSEALLLLTNVWNFTGPNLSLNAFYQHGPYGVQVGTEYYYAQWPYALLPVAYPFTAKLWLNSTITDGRDAVDFDVQVNSSAHPSENVTEPYDYVIFNSTAPGGRPLTQPSPYTANGYRYNPVGLPDDFEIDLGGPGGGSQATLFAADADLQLAYWDGTGYASVPSAFDFGSETGETSTGAAIGWQPVDAPSEPAPPSGIPGVAQYAQLTTGPAELTGLWNASSPSGTTAVTLATSPSNAFNLFAAAGSNFTVAEFSLAPQMYTNTVYLVPGVYTVQTELSDYAPVLTTLTVGATPLTLSVALAPNSAFGIYTPLWAFSNAQIPALATGGLGTPHHPYLIDNNQYGTIGSAFGLYNDYGFPVYPAVFFANTNASVEFLHPPSFATATNTLQAPGPQLPSSNDLQYWFQNVSNVSIVGAASIGGWFDAYVFYPAFFNTFSVIFWASTHDLIADDAFAATAGGLLLASSGYFFPALVLGEGNNTVWGDHFVRGVDPPSTATLLSTVFAVGLEIAEPNDTVYNNYFGTPTTAWAMPIDLYSGAKKTFVTTWNISRQPATAVHYAPGFPLEPLTGSILGTSYQGGNYWWDYGLGYNPYNGANNPYGLLPYEERATTLLAEILPGLAYNATYIYPGGDYVPLTNVTALYPFSVKETGLPTGLDWVLEVGTSSGSELLWFSEAAAPTETAELPDGSYLALVAAPDGWQLTYGHVAFTFYVLTIDGAGQSLAVKFQLAKGFSKLTFHESGLPKGTDWSVTINGTGPIYGELNATESTTAASLAFAVLKAGTYSYAVAPIAGYLTAAATGHASSGVVKVKFAPYTYAVTFTESGLAPGTLWKVTVDHKTLSSHTDTIVFELANGTYRFTVHAPKHTTAAPATGTFEVVGAAVPESISFGG